MKSIKVLTTILILFFFGACSSSPFKPISYNATFEMLDTSEDGMITLDEFTSHFPQSNKQFPTEADADNDGQIYPDEWFEFREKRGYLKPPSNVK